MLILRGKAWRLGDNVDTDAIIPARYLNRSQPEELAEHCLEDLAPDFAVKVQCGDIVVAGANFGCGSSREHAPLALKACGVSCVVAESFARIFYRNAINCGLPILDCPEAARDSMTGDVLTVDLQGGTIVNDRLGKTYTASPVPDFVMEIVQAGGLVELTRRRLRAEGKGKPGPTAGDDRGPADKGAVQ